MKKILLIDDSPLMRRVISDIINATNEYCVAYTAINGLEGLTILREHDDILAVFCDINMPGMDGISLLRIAKDEGMKPPFIMCSSSNDAHDTISALECKSTETLILILNVIQRISPNHRRNVIPFLTIFEKCHKSPK